jgi:hypothetical protein
VKVFEEEWIQQFRKRFDNSSVRKPFLYHVATDPSFDALRTKIESLVALWPEDIRKSLIDKLRNPRHFKNTYNELVVGSHLKALGHEPIYEKSMDGLTPDYYVQEAGGGEFIVEVFTCNLSDEDVSYVNQVADLGSRIDKIPFGAHVKLVINLNEIALDQKRNKSISAAVKGWLQTRPAVSSTLELEGVECELLAYSEFPNVGCMIGSFGGDCWGSNAQLAEAIHEKIKKYKKLGLRMYIAIVAEQETGLTLEDLVNVLFGSEALQIQMDKTTGEIESKQMVRMDDGIADKIPSHVAGILWMSKGPTGWAARLVSDEMWRS